MSALGTPTEWARSVREEAGEEVEEVLAVGRPVVVVVGVAGEAIPGCHPRWIQPRLRGKLRSYINDPAISPRATA